MYNTYVIYNTYLYNVLLLLAYLAQFLHTAVFNFVNGVSLLFLYPSGEVI